MKARILKCVLCCLLVFGMVAGYAIGISADREMAYNIYSDPDLQGETLFDTYVIEFMSKESATYTYWALSNFGLYLSPQTKAKYKSISGGGGYAGLQDRGNGVGRGHSAIMSFWEWTYKSTKGDEILRASRMWPEPWTGDSEFTGEGEGTNWITPYNWVDNQWYRMVIHTWDDPKTGRTFMGQWFQDIATGEWSLISYFDTKMYKSCLTGNQHFFMENYFYTTSNLVRDGYFKNIYARTYNDQEWISVNTTTLHHCNNGANNKIGAHSFGATDEFFWVKSGGDIPEGMTQAQHDAAWPKKTYSITQPSTPTFTAPSIDTLTVVKEAIVDEKGETVLDENGEPVIGWVAKWDASGTPQLSYKLVVKGVDGKTLLSKNVVSAPEVEYLVLEGVETDAFTCQVTITDLFGEKATLSESTEAYKEQAPEEDDTTGDKPTEDNTGDNTGNTTPDNNTGDNNTGDNNTTDTTPDSTDKDNIGNEGSDNNESNKDDQKEPTENNEDDKQSKKKDDFPIAIVIAAVAGVLVIGVVAAILVVSKKKKKE